MALQSSGMLSRDHLLHLFARFASVTSQPDVKKRIADAAKDKQEVIAITTAIQEDIFLEMGIDPRFGIACLGKVNAMYESDMDLMIQFHQFVANARQVDHPICDDLVLGVPHQGAMEVLQKHIKMTEGSDGDGGGGEGGGDEMATDMGSEEIEQNIQHIFEKIKHFTQQVGDLLEAGRTMFRNLSVEFEERLLSIHKEQLEKWQDEIKELQSCDASNETARALLDNAQHLLCSAHQDATYQYQATEPMLD